MKKQFLTYLKNELNKANRLIARNGISEEDKVALAETIDNLKSIIAEVETMEEVQTAEEVLGRFKDEIESKLTALAEKIENNAGGPTPQPSNYLESENALHDFCNAIRAAQGEKGRFSENWNKKLSENGITIATGDKEVVLPAAVKGIITDIWQAPHNWLNRLTNTGAKRFIARFNTSTQSAETSRAKGHKAGTDKVAQSITISQKEINAQFIYKMIDVSRQNEWMDDGSLIRYVMKELVNQIKWEIERAILIGDGRSNSNNSKITAIEAINRSQTDNFVTIQAYNSEKALIEQLVDLASSVIAERSNITLFLTRANANVLRKVVFSSTSTPQYISLADVAQQIGVGEIIETDHLEGSVTAIAVDLAGISTVGSINPTLAQWEDYKTNTLWWRYECPFGAGLARQKCAAVLGAAAE